MPWVAQLFLAQAAQTTGGPLAELTTAIYAVGGVVTALGALFGVDKVAFWRHRRRNGNGEHGTAAIVELAASNKRIAHAVERLEDRLSEELRQLRDICTRLEDRSR